MKLISIHDLVRLRAGDRTVFSQIYDEYSGDVYRLAFRFLKDQTLSEEVVQETFIKLWLNKEKIDEQGNAWLYLYVIAKRLSLNHLRKIHHSSELRAQLLINMSQISNSTEEEVLRADMERFTEELVSKLPPQQQLVFKFSRVEGLTHKEIAQRLNISPNTVKNHVIEALKTIKANLKCADSYGAILLFFLFK